MSQICCFCQRMNHSSIMLIQRNLALHETGFSWKTWGSESPSWHLSSTNPREAIISFPQFWGKEAEDQKALGERSWCLLSSSQRREESIISLVLMRSYECKERNNSKKTNFPHFETITLTTDTIFSINLLPFLASQSLLVNFLRRTFTSVLTDQQVTEVGGQVTLIFLLLDQLSDWGAQ